MSNPPQHCADASVLFQDRATAAADLDAFRSTIESDYQLYEQRRSELASKIPPTGGVVQRLKSATLGATYSKKLRCLMPVTSLDQLEKRHSFDRDLLSLKLKRGRACKHELCSSDRCGLHIRDAVISADEASALIAHGQSVLDAEGVKARDVGWPYLRIDFMRSAQNGSTVGHLLSLRIAERLRRLAAQTFDLPLERLGISETLLALRRTEVPRGLELSDGKPFEQETMFHVDESLSKHFHFSTIVWLSTHGSDFEAGGEVLSLHAFPIQTIAPPALCLTHDPHSQKSVSSPCS
jgi:hypothetical protein